MATTATSARPHALSALLAQHIAGNLADGALSSMTELFEDTNASAAERVAFARFYLDLKTAGETPEALPKADELADVLAIARA